MENIKFSKLHTMCDLAQQYKICLCLLVLIKLGNTVLIFYSTSNKFVETQTTHTSYNIFSSVVVNDIPPTLRLGDEQCLISVEMKFFRKTASYNLLDQKKNELIITEYLHQYRRNWLKHMIIIIVIMTMTIVSQCHTVAQSASIV